MQLKLLEGREFSRDFPSDSTGFMVNETALKIIGYTQPVGKPLEFEGKHGKIIGVIKDFHFSSLHKNVEPLIIPYGEEDNNGFALIRIQPGKTEKALAGLESVYKKMNTNFPFTFSFADEDYNSLYQNDQIVGKLSKAFSFLAIFIACLGLWGLAIFTAEQRVKEIGIRKVLGAGVWSLFALLSSGFLVLVVIALFIAVPLAWYAMNGWLQSFAYHPPLKWWIFALPGGFIILIALATISYQVIKATLVNPTVSLRTE
jgi:putative ABC transport system permease protein